jgi:Asp-tRNA(Asn)/Glu-tRNA(Gln) amidotransferase A subunit family amidase
MSWLKYSIPIRTGRTPHDRRRSTGGLHRPHRRIAATDGRVNAFTAVLEERALKRADLVDASPRRSRMRLAGVPFAVKNLFDVAGIATLAGSKIEATAAPARRDAVLMRRLEAEDAPCWWAR